MGTETNRDSVLSLIRSYNYVLEIYNTNNATTNVLLWIIGRIGEKTRKNASYDTIGTFDKNPMLISIQKLGI